MSILTSIINSIRAATSNEAFKQIQSREVTDQIMKAVNEASKDGQITAEEILGIKKLVDDLKMGEDILNDVKLKVLRDLVEHVMKDKKISEEEKKLVSIVEDGLAFKMAQLEKLRADLQTIKHNFQL